MLKTHKMDRLERHHGKPIEVLLMDLYWRRRLSLRETAQELGVHFATVERWLRAADIPLRAVSTGENRELASSMNQPGGA